MDMNYRERYQGPLSFVNTIEDLLERKSSGSGLETEISVVGDPLR
jgi:hypothetical protein